MGLSMNERSCLFPLVGKGIYGFFGELIDTFSIITTLFGVCTSLGLGVMQLNSGFAMLSKTFNPDGEQIKDPDVSLQVTTTILITCLATISCISGIGKGIRRISETCFALGQFILMCVMLSPNCWFYMNLWVQQIGMYLQTILLWGFNTDAFEQQGMAPDGLGGIPQQFDWWTIFYYGWWVSWSPFVGTFIAKISRGRTIRQFIFGVLCVPIL